MSAPVTPKTVARFSTDWLAGLAQVGDPAADGVILKLQGDNPTAAHSQAAFPDLTRRIWAADPDPEIAKFLAEGEQLDDLIDGEKVRHAQAFFEEHGVAVITALFHAALPEAYLGQRGVQVLDLTGELVSNWSQRVIGTGQFLLSVLTSMAETVPGRRTSLAAGEHGAVTARRVRLTHAAIRWMLDASVTPTYALSMQADLENASRWTERMVDIGEEVEEDGKHVVTCRPVNQEDLLATLGTFTTVTFDALSKLALTFDDDDRDAYHHLWNVVGWHLGVGDGGGSMSPPDELAPTRWPDNTILPLDVAEMDELYLWLSTELQRTTSQGCRLAKTLVQELALPLPGPLRGMPSVVVRYLIGDEKADCLQIEKGGYTELLTVRTGLLERVARRGARLPVGPVVMSLAGQALTRYALREFVARARGGDRGLRIDPVIAARWGVQTGPEMVPRRRA